MEIVLQQWLHFSGEHMESHQVLKQSIDRIGVKKAAADMGLSTSMIYKWCEEDEDSSGARNPLDRITRLCEVTGDVEAVSWLCQQVGGTLVLDPEVEPADPDTRYLEGTQEILGEFSGLLETMSASITNDGKIDIDESKQIRTKWTALKRYAEQFVQACEKGLFDEEKK